MAHGFNFLGERVPDQRYSTPRACDIVAGAALHAKLMTEYGVTAQPESEVSVAPTIAEVPVAHSIEVPEVTVMFGAVAHTQA
jgi:hypothetical protein